MAEQKIPPSKKRLTRITSSHRYRRDESPDKCFWQICPNSHNQDYGHPCNPDNITNTDGIGIILKTTAQTYKNNPIFGANLLTANLLHN